MNKDDIYKLIGYQGEYTPNIKKAIRKLLKENHPDNQGNRYQFELINEVKNELENNKVPTKYQKKNSSKLKKNDDIDYEYCKEQIKALSQKLKEYSLIHTKYKQELKKLEEEYPEIYRNSIDLELNLLSSSIEARKIQNIKVISTIMIVIISIIFILSIIMHNNVLLIIFTLLTILCVFIVERYFVLINEITKNNKKRLKDYVLVNKLIRDNTLKQDELKNKVLSISKKIKLVENDLRFYNNLLK